MALRCRKLLEAPLVVELADVALGSLERDRSLPREVFHERALGTGERARVGKDEEQHASDPLSEDERDRAGRLRRVHRVRGEGKLRLVFRRRLDPQRLPRARCIRRRCLEREREALEGLRVRQREAADSEPDELLTVEPHER